MTRAGTPRRRGGRQARRPGLRLPLRLPSGRLPGPGRLAAAVVLAAFLGAGLVAVGGPWLRLDRVVFSGERYTTQDRLEAIVAPFLHGSLLTLDAASLRDRVGTLPTIASVGVETVLPDEVRVAVTEKTPAVLWQTRAGLLIGAADGSLMSELPLDATVDPGLALLPRIDDERDASRTLTPGDAIDPEELHIADRLLAVQPALLGSRATSLSVSIVDEDGFLLVSDTPAWSVALGFFGLDPAETRADEDARLDAQLTAVRTLFANVDETGVSWVDVRNPGKVYWKP